MHPNADKAKIAARFQLRRMWKIEGHSFASPLDFLDDHSIRIANDVGISVIFLPQIDENPAIAGLLDRRKSEILISTNTKVSATRFTLAHEIGHFFLHPGEIYFRDRSIADHGDGTKPKFEREADSFAAEFLMPPKFLSEIFIQIFGGKIDHSKADPLIVDALNINSKVKFALIDFNEISKIDFALRIAKLRAFGNRNFKPLYELFRVSQTAMAIQLCDCNLIV